MKEEEIYLPRTITGW